MKTPIELLEEALKNLRKDRKEIYFRIEALKIESKGYTQPQKELSVAKSIAKFFDTLQKINSEIVKISSELNKIKEDEYVFDSIGGDLYSNIGDEITVSKKEE